MDCKVCKLPANIDSAYTEEKDGKTFLVQVFKCRCKWCQMYGQEVGKKVTQVEEGVTLFK